MQENFFFSIRRCKFSLFHRIQGLRGVVLADLSYNNGSQPIQQGMAPNTRFSEEGFMLRFGLDLGGTKTEGAVLDSKRRVLFRERIPTGQDQGYEGILRNLSGLYENEKNFKGQKTHAWDRNS
jgi:hypothetical protein